MLLTVPHTAQPVPSAALLAEGILPLQTKLELRHQEDFDPCERQAESTDMCEPECNCQSQDLIDMRMCSDGPLPEC